MPLNHPYLIGVITVNLYVLWLEYTLSASSLKFFTLLTRFASLVSSNPPLLKRMVNVYFYPIFMSLSQKKTPKKQEKIRSKVGFCKKLKIKNKHNLTPILIFSTTSHFNFLYPNGFH